MMLNHTVTFLLWATIALVVGTLAGMSKLSDIQEQKIEQRLKQLNKPTVKSVHSPDGDIIDCVWIYDQPAFDHPLLKNHTIQMRPKSDSIRDKTEDNKTDVIHQLWRTKGECPENTIPIIRRTRDDLLRSIPLKLTEERAQQQFHQLFITTTLVRRKFMRSYMSCTVTIIQDFSPIGRAIHTKRWAGTTLTAQALFK